VTVVRHIYGAAEREALPEPRVAPRRRAETAVVAIGASTGGPRLLDDLLSALPGSYGPAVVVVQHMADGFLTGWLTALRQRCALELKVAEDGDRLHSGRVLFAPPASHLTVMAGGRVRLEEGAPVGGFCPSVDLAFATIAQVYGKRAAGVLLTGMGVDGAAGLLAIRRAGGVTMVQDEASCVVFGMPRAAIDLDAAQHVLPPAHLARRLLALHGRRGDSRDR
jgi:two-component system chemotaxis response regulator CheB